nr:MAG TPA: hypothetical protein [Caudoviricetes sp.]
MFGITSISLLNSLTTQRPQFQDKNHSGAIFEWWGDA